MMKAWIAIGFLALVVWLVAASYLTVYWGGIAAQIDPWARWFEYATQWYYQLTDPVADYATRRFLMITGLAPLGLAGLIGAGLYQGWQSNRTRRRFGGWWRQGDDSPRPLERGTSDNHGHARMATEAWLRQEFPPPRRRDRGVKVVGFAGSHLLYDTYGQRSRVSLEFSGTRSGKTASIISMLAYWAATGLPQVVLDPSEEIVPMMWGLLVHRFGRQVRILHPDPNPFDRNGNPVPWRHLIADYDALGWIDIDRPGATGHIRTFARYFIDSGKDRSDAPSGSGAEYWANAERNLIACLLAHILWYRGPHAPPRTLETLRAVLSLDNEGLADYLRFVYHESPSPMARHLAGRMANLGDDAEKGFTYVADGASQATSWLTNPELARMVSGSSFSANDITNDNPVSVVVNIPMDTLLTDGGVARVIFGSFFTAKIASKSITDTLFVPDEPWLLGRAEHMKIALFAGGKHGIVMHLPWQSMGQLEDIWGIAGRKFWLDNAAYVMIGRVRDPNVAKEVSEIMGTMPVIAYSEGDNVNTQSGTGLLGRFGRGRNTNRHEISRHLRTPAEIISDLERDDLLVVGLRYPALWKRALWFRIPWLAELIEPSPYDRQDEEDMEEELA